MIAAAACSAQTPTPGPSADESAQSGLQQVPLTIRAANGPHPFTVEVARTPEEQATGLMYRTSLAADRGMIFPFDPPQDASFWMKNTLIPLDMIFIAADGRIVNIAERTVPLSTAPIYSSDLAVAVLEVNGGTAARLGIRPGDRVRFPMFGNAS